MNPATLNALVAFPRLLEQHYAAIPAEYRQWAPTSWDGVPGEPFTAIEQVCHLRDIEIDGYQLRFHRTLHESNPTLASLDSDALADERSYQMADGDAVLDEFRAARAQTVALISALGLVELARPAQFEGYGRATLRSLVHYLCSHDQQHLAGLQWLLGQIEGQRARTQS